MLRVMFSFFNKRKLKGEGVEKGILINKKCYDPRLNESLGLALPLPKIFFCSSFALFSSRFFNFCFSCSNLICSSIMASLSSAWKIKQIYDEKLVKTFLVVEMLTSLISREKCRKKNWMKNSWKCRGHFLATINFDFPRKLSKSKVMENWIFEQKFDFSNIVLIDVDYLPFSFAVPRFSFDFQPLFVQPQLFFLCPLPRNLYWY